MKFVRILTLVFCITELQAQVPFEETPSSVDGGLVIPKGMNYQLLFREGDTVINANGKTGPAKGNHDYNVYIPIEGSLRGRMFTSHEENMPSDVAGDGGGATIYEVENLHGAWVSKKKYVVDFSKVGGTFNNCSGALTPKGTILSAEEAPPVSNAALLKSYYSPTGIGFRDTSDFNGLKRYQQMGWMVEIDPISRQAMHKLYKMGRFSHEGAWIMEDKKTVYLTDDYYPAVFFKFVAEKENDFTEGQLYAYQQGKGGKANWVKLPMEMDSLLVIRDVALKRGATIFARHEWIVKGNGKLYITETGYDKFTVDPKVTYNGEVAYYLQNKRVEGTNTYEYPFGAILEFDLKTEVLKPVLFGGQGKKDTLKHFSNPDGVAFSMVGGKPYLVVHEDLIGVTLGRVPEKALAEKKYINEIWWLDLSVSKPTVDDLKRFMVIPEGAESSGGYFTPDASTYFVNIQHPSSSNSYPFNKSCTIAVTGFKSGKNKKK